MSETPKRMPTLGSLFAGIGGFDRGFELAGFRTVWQVEKEPFCQAVLRTQFPKVRIFNDVCSVGKQNLQPVDVLTAGFPCQDLSVAGKRAGLEGTRSGLFWEVVRILGELRPAWFVLENVPGLFSSGEGRDFAIVLNALDELGYGVAWRVLDSQYFGVAQRRRRVFIVGCFGKPCPEEILFESEGGAGDIAEGREAWTGTPEETSRSVAPTIHAGLGHHGWSCGDQDFELLQPTVAASLRASDGHHGFSSPRGDGSDNLVCGPLGGSSRSGGYQPNAEQAADGFLQLAHTLSAANHDTSHAAGRRREDDFNLAIASLSGIGNGGPDDNDGQARRIVECSAPDSNGVRDIASLPEGMDSSRYRALGNAVTASVAYWIAKRIANPGICEGVKPQ